MTSFRSPLRLFFLISIIGFFAIVFVVVVALITGAGSSGQHQRSYSSTLGDAQKQFGADARVVKIDADEGGVEYEVLNHDASLVLIRNYTVSSYEISAGTTGYNNKTDDSQRIAKPADVRQAAITLGQLNGDIVEQLWADAGFSDTESSATLNGTTWTIESGAHPSDQYQANYDGTGFHQTQGQ